MRELSESGRLVSLAHLARLGVRGEAHVLAVTIEVRVADDFGCTRGAPTSEVVFAESETDFLQKMLRRAVMRPRERWTRISEARYVRKSLPPVTKSPWKGSP